MKFKVRHISHTVTDIATSQTRRVAAVVVPERTAGAAVAAGSAGRPEAECGRQTGTAVGGNRCGGT